MPEHLSIEPADRSFESAIDRGGIAELRPDVTEIDAADEDDVLAAGPFHRFQCLDERADLGVIDGVDPTLHTIMKRSDQNRHDQELAIASQYMLEKDGLELDGMLTAVNQLVVEELSPCGPGNLLHIVAIGPHEPQRRFEVFEGQRESAAAILMSDPQNYECVDAWLLRQGRYAQE